MDIIFIRHAEGKHTIDLPNSLYLEDPTLTVKGESQARSLQQTFSLTLDDLMVISPMRRTLQTASLFAHPIMCESIVHPFVGPRVFPLNKSGNTLPCDQLLAIEMIREDFPSFHIHQADDPHLWKNGINTISQTEFELIARDFLNWCKSLKKDRLFIVSHDGTITAYRELIKNVALTRDDFLHDAGWVIEKI
ncbi:histidine phosphatase family protein [Alkalihalobacillus pseudalcaliphilus]|uniref:histidine phosphatase family protein n=1 Tax=Alkalihalobacillus pseudalcaliphilus TaxID=79884 RepID=UPI00064DF13B|nr:histidine phosphatase family protein [Alkalihalobacillus pseudalcaliphilus]KMK76781.1 phosphoglycerate mutase [Alkalihalobacillus pseudalcaliphilus]